MTEATEQTRGSQKERIGTVTRATTPKTVVVQVERITQHPKYHKVIRIQKRYVVHDEKAVAKLGDRVRITETRPISKTKRWRLTEVLKKV